jgi:hypothetical protein
VSHFALIYRNGNKAIAMKKLITVCTIAIFCFLLVFISCKKSGTITYHNQGVITAICPMCACAACGGYFIKFNSDTATLYRIDNDLSKFGINGSSNFPINVAAEWQFDAAIKSSNDIIITQLRIIN